MKAAVAKPLERSTSARVRYESASTLVGRNRFDPFAISASLVQYIAPCTDGYSEVHSVAIAGNVQGVEVTAF